MSSLARSVEGTVSAVESMAGVSKDFPRNRPKNSAICLFAML